MRPSLGLNLLIAINENSNCVSSCSNDLNWENGTFAQHPLRSYFRFNIG